MRPAGAFITGKTSSGIEFQWDLESLRARGARDASMEQALVLVEWSTRDRFLRDAVGYTEKTLFPGDERNGHLRRTLPLKHYDRLGFYCDDYELVDYGAYETRTDFHSPAPDANNGPAQDWARYLLTFVRHKYSHFKDDEIVVGGKFFEQLRCTTLTRMPRPRERVVSGMGYEYQKLDGTWATITDERQFIPDYQVDLTCSWLQIPVESEPTVAIAECLNAVNAKTIGLSDSGRVWDPGELLFKGLGKAIEQYADAADFLCVDLVYLFSFQPGGWNKYLVRDAAGAKSYRPVRIRGGAGAGFPPYPSADFQRLFTPA
jgi:hypothetical protein